LGFSVLKHLVRAAERLLGDSGASSWSSDDHRRKEEEENVKTSQRFAVAVIAVSIGVTGAVVTSGRAEIDGAAPVVKMKTSQFGNVLATRGRKALYYWNVEKRDFKVHCTGACARAWPPLLVGSRGAVPQRVAGIRGKFGVIRRPDGKLQVTHNRLPIYTYAHERPNQVLCNNVDGWFVVRT